MESSDEPEQSPAIQQPLLAPSASARFNPDPIPIAYTHSPRPVRDLPFLLVFLLLSLSTFALGFFSLAKRNRYKSQVSQFTYDPSLSSCVLVPTLSASHSFLFSHSFVEYLIPTLVISLLFLPLISFALLFFLKHCAKQVVYISVPFFILTPAFFNAYWFAVCTIGASCQQALPLSYRIIILIFVFLIIGLVLWIIIANWHRVELTIQIIQVSSDALAENLALILVLPILALLYVLFYFAPVVIFLIFATYNGKIVPSLNKSEYYECVWKQDKWVSAYFALAIISLIWSAGTMIEAQVYVITGTVAQWYFSIDGSRPRKSLRRSLRNAFGPSFGTICLSGLITGIVRFIRAVLEAAKREQHIKGCVTLILKCCADCLLSSVDFVNKFTINFAAITGEAYCSAAKMTYELLKRNLLSAVFVETVSTRLLFGIIFVLSSLYSIAVYAILKSISGIGNELYFIAGFTWLLMMIFLGYFVHVLDSVIDVVYICYAMDRDRGDVTKDHVHHVYEKIPLNRNHSFA
ncbi:hypothetical protein LUZ60_016201 [Juncus effusus]|nr:hypothetical protein LUZ60_016201 [Juncus effusus]